MGTMKGQKPHVCANGELSRARSSSGREVFLSATIWFCFCVEAGPALRPNRTVPRAFVQVAWSPDGKYLCCGDGEGFVWFWEWKSSKIVKKIKFHEKVCIGLLWHPVEQSRMASCSWDATVKLWD